MKNVDTEIAAVVAEAIERLNETLTDRPAVDSHTGTVLIGDGGALDSIGLVLLIAAIEEEVERRWQLRVSLIDLVAADTRVPRTVGDLTRGTAELINQARVP